METCTEAFGVADAALLAGHEVRVVPATLVRSLGVGARRLKTDRRDAQVLSEVSCRIDLPSVHVPSLTARQRKTLCGMREALVGARTKVLNTVRGWLRAEGRRPRGGDVATFTTRVRALCALPSYVDRQLRTIDALTEQIAEADRELAATARADPIARRLMTAPGVGPATAVRFVAALDEISRFTGAHAVESYLGLVPGEDSSAERKR
jgi:transposase